MVEMGGAKTTSELPSQSASLTPFWSFWDVERWGGWLEKEEEEEEEEEEDSSLSAYGWGDELPSPSLFWVELVQLLFTGQA